MADQATTNANLYTAFNVNANLLPTTVKPTFLPIPTATTIGAVRAGTNITIDANGVISSTGGSGSSLTLQVDGVTVNPVNNIISFDDSQEPFNQCFFEAVNNSIRVGIDGDTTISVPAISLVAANTPRVSFTASPSTTAYSLVMPLAQGAGNTFLRNDGSGNLSWAAETGTGTVTSVTTNITAFTVTAPTTTPVLSITGGSAGQFLRQDGTWATPPDTGVTSVTFTAPASNAFSVTNPTITPSIAFQNVGATPSTVFLRGDGTWATPAGSGSGTVTSVALTAPAEFTVSGSPITTNGTIAITKANQAANLFYAGPTTGAANLPTFRAVAKADVIAVTNTGIRADTNTYLQGDVTFAGGSNVTLTQSGNVITINSTGGGGGGGGVFTSTAIWTGGTASKNAYTAPGVVNTQGITINLVASSGTGQLTAVTVSLDGVALTNTYTSTGTFPNYTIAIPSADLTGNVAETDASVVVSLLGTFNGTNFNIANAGTLTNVQPVAFTTTLSGSYLSPQVPFYLPTETILYSYSNSANITARNGVITPVGGTAQNATANSGNLANQPPNGATISGTATGNGQFGAGSSTVTLSGSIPAATIYTPAFYSQTANVTPPTFTTASLQTSGAAVGSMITFPTATASTQYNWICTQRPLANILVVTPFGNSPLVPDVNAPTQTISGQTFNVYGITRLTVGSAVQLVIT